MAPVVVLAVVARTRTSGEGSVVAGHAGIAVGRRPRTGQAGLGAGWR